MKIKNLWIYEDQILKKFINLPTDKETPTFYGFLADNNNDMVFRNLLPIQATLLVVALLLTQAYIPTTTIFQV